MLRWPALAALVAPAVAGCVSAADAQYISQHSIKDDFPNDPTYGSGTVAGIWSDGTTMWVIEDFRTAANGDTGRILAYHLKDLSRYTDSTKDFAKLALGVDSSTRNRSPDGIWSDGTTMWVADSITSHVYAYNLQSKAYDAARSFSLDGVKNQAATGIWGDGTTLYVADYADPQVHAFDMSNQLSISSKSEESLLKATMEAANNDVVWGIWSDCTTMWVADDEDDHVYAYHMSNKSRDTSRDFGLHSSNGLPRGMWSNGTTMWVLDGDNDKEKIFIYALDPPAVSCPSPPAPTPRGYVYVPPSDTIPPKVVSVERAGNPTTTDRALTWEVTFSEPVVMRTNIHTDFTRHSPDRGAVHFHAAARTNLYTSYTAVANATIPDLGAAHDTMLVDVPGVAIGGSVSVDLHHPIRTGLLIELVAPDCTRFVVHNQTTTFPYKLRQPYDLGNLDGVGAAGQWTLHVSDHAKYWDGTLNAWSLDLESEGAAEGAGTAYAITQYVAGPGTYALSLDGYDIWDLAGNPLAGTDPAVNEPYHVVGAARTCQTE